MSPPAPNRKASNGSVEGRAASRFVANRDAVRDAVTANILLSSLTSDQLARFNFSHRAGIAYGGLRDYELSLGYLHNPTVHDYRRRYNRWGIARRIVDAYPHATWSGGADIRDDDDPTVTTEFELAVTDLFERLDVWQRLRRADIVAGLGRFGVLFIGAPGDPSSPLGSVRGPDDILYLQPLGEDRIQGLTFDTRTGSPRFGLPDTYQLMIGTLESIAGTSSTRTVTRTEPIHHTRIIHLSDGLLDDDVFGTPRLEPVWNYLDDLIKVVGGGSEAAWKRADPGVKVKYPLMTDDGQPIDLDPEGEEKLEEEVEDYIHGLTRVIRLRGVDMDLMESQVTSFNRNADALLRLISGTTGIPVRIMTGSERGELASSQDRANWNERALTRRREYATPLVRGLVDRFISVGALPEPRRGEYTSRWPEAALLDEQERAELARTHADANKKQFDAAGTIILSSDEIRDRVLGMGPLEDEELIEREDREGGDEDRESGNADEEVGGRGDLLAAQSLDIPTAGPPPDSPDWRRTTAAATRHLESLAALSLDAWRVASDSLDEAELTAVLSQRNSGRANALVEMAIRLADLEIQNRLPALLLATSQTSADSALRAARTGDGFTAASLPKRWVDSLVSSRARLVTAQESLDEFDPLFTDEAVRIASNARRQAEELVQQIRPGTVSALQAFIVVGLAAGLAPRLLARTLKESVGLRSDQVDAVSNLAQELLAARPGQTITRFRPTSTSTRQRPGFLAKVPPDGPTPVWVDRQLTRYRRMQLNLRARLIARSQGMRAANAGVKELWLQAREAGLLPAGVQRVWITAGDEAVRPDHRVMEGVRVPIDEPFWVPDGTTEPSEAPGCRCVHALTIGVS